MNILRKPLSGIGVVDLEELAETKARETAELEFKGSLPFKAEKGKPAAADRWIEKGDYVGDYARDELISELVGFANADGGTLVLGLHETKETPRRADYLEPLPRCEDLRKRLLDASEDIVEPRLRTVDAVALQTGEDGRGYVVFRVGKSLQAPHRLTTTLQFPIRRGERTSSMTVRELKDLTLALAQMGDKVNGELARRHKEAAQYFLAVPRDDPKTHRPPLMMRATSLPTTPQNIPNLTSTEDLWWRGSRFVADVGSRKIECGMPARDFGRHPVVRLRSLQSDPRDDDSRITRVLDSSALVEFVFLLPSSADRPRNDIFLGWLVATVAGTLCQIEWLRQKLGMDGTTFALDVDLRTYGPARLLWEEDYGRYEGRLETSNVHCPLYEVGPRTEFNDLVTLFIGDILNAAGEKSKATISVPWDSLLR